MFFILGERGIGLIFLVLIGYFFYINRNNWKIPNSNIPANNNTANNNNNNVNINRNNTRVMGINDIRNDNNQPPQNPGNGFF